MDKTVCNTCTKSAKCLPIMITDNSTCNCVNLMKTKCIDFTRATATYGDTGCKGNLREQLNNLTPFIDGSVIYGLNDATLMSLRDKKEKGLMLIQDRGSICGHLLPANPVQPRNCFDTTNTTKCFLAGENKIQFKYINISINFAKLNTKANRE